MTDFLQERGQLTIDTTEEKCVVLAFGFDTKFGHWAAMQRESRREPVSSIHIPPEIMESCVRTTVGGSVY